MRDDRYRSRSRSSRRTGLLAATVVISVAILYTLPGASSVEITVDDDWAGADFSTIQDALNASLDGDTIRVYEGAYPESITILRQVEIIGNGSSMTIVNGSVVTDVVTIVADHVTIASIGIETKVMRFEGSGIVLDNLTVTKDIYLFRSNDNEIRNCSITGTLDFERSEGSIITDTVVQRGRSGVDMSYSDSNVFSNVTIVDSLFNGVDISHSFGNRFFECTIENGTLDGINLYWSGNNTFDDVEVSEFQQNGLDIAIGSGNLIVNSTFHDNNWSGALLRQDSQDNEIKDNVFDSNGAFGVSIVLDEDDSVDNWIHRNTFVDNGFNTSQGFDEIGNNHWSRQGVGNDWSDYDGDDENKDGRGDDPYSILGGNETDDSPILDWGLIDNEVPEITYIDVSPDLVLMGDPVDLTAVATDDGMVVLYTWSSDLDGELNSGSEANFSTEDLSNGTHNITLMVEDDRGTLGISPELSVFVNIRPYISITDPENGSTVSGIIEVNGSAGDDDGEMVSVEIALDGGAWGEIPGSYDWNQSIDTEKIWNGVHNITARAWDGFHYSINATITIIVDNQPDIEPEKDPTEPLISDEEGLIILGVVVASVVAFSATGIGFYTLFAFLFPLYSRLKEESVADQKTRGRMIEYIRHNPGAHFSMIKKDLDMPNGSAGYHLRVLESSGFIRARSDGFYKRFYPHGYRIPEFVLDGMEQNIVAFVQAEPGIAQKDLAQRIGLSPSTVSHHIKRLKRKRVVTASRGKGINLTDDYIAVTETEAAAAEVEVVEPIVVVEDERNA